MSSFKKLVSLFALTVMAAALGAAETSTAAPASTVVQTDPFWPADGIFPVPGKTSSWAGFRKKNVERRTLFAQQKAHDHDAIVFVGDSITEGWKTLEQDFADIGVPVVNRGIGGDTTPNLIYRLQEDVLSLHPRALVVLLDGVVGLNVGMIWSSRSKVGLSLPSSIHRGRGGGWEKRPR